MIELSVQMPMFRVKYIAWLALESLCRQKNISFEWELIVTEEMIGNEVFGRDEVFSYAKRLRKVGCKKIVYIGLRSWIPLATKLGLLTDYCTKTSKIVSFQSADYYSSPFILTSQWKAFEDPEIEWFSCSPSTIFYDVATGISKVTANGPKGSGRAYLTSISRMVGKGTRRKGVDKWLWQTTHEVLKRPPRIHVDKKENWKYAFNVNGFHNCTLSRGRKIRTDHKKWSDIKFDWKDNIPVEIMKRVVESKQFISKHRLGLEKSKATSSKELKKIVSVVQKDL